MADQNIVQTLFGFTPQNVQQQMISAGDQQAMELAKLSRGPVAASEFYGLRAAGRVGTNPLFTQNAPQVQKAGQLQQIIQQVQSSGVDMSTPDGLIELANALNTNPEFSGMAVAIRQEANKLAQKQQLTAADIFQKQATGTAALARAAQEREPVVKTTADFAEVANELGFKVKPNLADYTADETRQINALLQKRKLEKAEAGAPKPTLTEKAVMPGKAKTLETIETGALQATKTNQTADAIDRVLTSAFTGFGAQTVLKAAQVANAFGVTVTGTSETEQLTQLLAQLAQGQAKTLPGALSEKELAFLREAIGTPGFTVTTLRNVVNRLRKDALSSEFENEEAQKFISGGGDLNKYDFVAARKRAQQRANQQIDERTAKQRRLEELRRKQQGQ